MRFAMAQVSRRRADQLGDLTTVLEFGTVNFSHRAGILEQCLGGCFHGPGFTGSRGAEKEKASNEPAWGIYAGDIHLINVDNLSNCFLLPDDTLAQVRLKL